MLIPELLLFLERIQTSPPLSNEAEPRVRFRYACVWKSDSAATALLTSGRRRPRTQSLSSFRGSPFLRVLR